ncbi:MAG: pilus assembly protein PilM [Candidatus Paceibacterota bacterium]
MKFNFKRLLMVINPQPVLAGLEISDLELRFTKVKGDNLISASVKLPPGIIKEGKIKDRPNFIAALSNLHSQITRKKKKKIYVIVSIPNINVYTQVFNLPTIASGNLEEAAKLNLQMISPIDFTDTYSDWQPVGENKTDGGQIEILGALAPRSIIEEFSSSLEEAGFGAVVIEFSALSLVRLVDDKTPYLLLQIGSDGLNFSIIRNGNLYFTHFNSWKTTSKEQGKISFSDFKELIIKETQKVLYFYEVHWGGRINKVILVSSGLNKEVIKLLSENLSLEVQPLTLKKFSQLSPDWYGVLSSALRGLIPRSQDTIISLASVGTEERFQRYRIDNFVNIWRNIILASLIFVIIVFGASWWFLINTMESISILDVGLLKASEITELNKLQEKAKSFNKKIEIALKAKQVDVNWSPFFEKINDLAGDDITLERIFVQSLEIPALINATAVSREAAINFKNMLVQQQEFYEVNLPLSNIISSIEGPVKFSISFKIKNLNF